MKTIVNTFFYSKDDDKTKWIFNLKIFRSEIHRLLIAKVVTRRDITIFLSKLTYDTVKIDKKDGLTQIEASHKENASGLFPAKRDYLSKKTKGDTDTILFKVFIKNQYRLVMFTFFTFVTSKNLGDDNLYRLDSKVQIYETLPPKAGFYMVDFDTLTHYKEGKIHKTFSNNEIKFLIGQPLPEELR